jgi:ribosomal protein S18 acetylase RimI-like enzyme
MWQIIQAETPAQIETARAMFLEYAEWLGFSLCFQGFDQELAALPGRYAPPSGRLLLAGAGENTAGVIALRPLDGQTCEMKRLYVRPAFRGQRLGRTLAEKLIAEARAIGYRRMALDTLPDRMGEAITLYRRLGFREIKPYYENPVAGAVFMELALSLPKNARIDPCF